MIKITKLTDIWKAHTIPKYIAEKMEMDMLFLFKEYLVEDISEFGSFYYMETKEDFERYKEIGMFERIDDAEPEWIGVFGDEDKTKQCIHGCYEISTDFAIYIFSEVMVFRD